MTRDEIIRMAREAGFDQTGLASFEEFTARIERFAALVAAAEPRRHQVAEKQEDSLAQTNWDNIPQAFNEWWNADYDDSTNPFRLNSPAYWAWSGWSAANKEKNT
jgi:hypothetical protein